MIQKTSSKRYKHLLPMGFAVIIIIMTANSFYGALQMKDKSTLMAKTVRQQTLNTELLGRMSNAIVKKSMLFLEILESKDSIKNEKLFNQLNQQTTVFLATRAKFESQNLQPKLQKLLSTQGQLLQINTPLMGHLYELIQWGDYEQAKAIFLNVILPRQKINLNLIKEMSDNQFWIAQDNIEQLQSENYQALSTILILGGISILFSISLTFFVLKKKKMTDRQLTYHASTDALTDLPNRSSFSTTITNHLKMKPTDTFAVVFIDIDYFKSINDNYGHHVGDKVLKQFSATIKAMTHPKDVLSRFGGDEFVLLLTSIHSKAEAKNFIAKLSKNLDTSFIIDDKEIFITSSIGVSFFPEPYAFGSSCQYLSAADLLKHADIAMYAAKESGRNCYQFFSRKSNERMEKEHAISHSLHSILKDNNQNNELYLAYQPLTNIKSEEITECEALIRWKNHEGKNIPPDSFIPLAEKSNLIEKINLFVIKEACKQQHSWKKEGITKLKININLSGNRHIFKNLLKYFNEQIDRYKLNPKDFGIELTERTLFEIGDETIKRLNVFKQQGMSISIDDFGTEYSSLIYLKKLPVTTLKIDKVFIDGIITNKEDQALVNTIITLGHTLQLKVVAEGIETYEQFEYLKNNACNLIQGFYLHKPMDSQSIQELKNVA